MTQSDPRKVARAYSIIDEFVTDEDPLLDVIVFSDTILVYNKNKAKNEKEKEVYIFYLIRFVQDLYSRFVGQDIWFRAIILPGEFNHYKLDNIDCFFGKSLIDAHQTEKSLPMIGLVIHNDCLVYNKILIYKKFNNEYNFVYLSYPLEEIHLLSNDHYPLRERNVWAESPDMPEGVRYLLDIYKLMRDHSNPSVRTKALTTWDFYAQRYPNMLAALCKINFSLDALAPSGIWESEEKRLKKKISHFKQAGRGTLMSLKIQNRERKTSASKRTP